MAAVPGILRKWNPGIVPGLALWVDGQDNASITMANTSNISAISDKSGLNIRLVQGIASNQPQLTSNVNHFQTIGFRSNDVVSTTTSYFPSLFNNTSNLSQFTVFSSRGTNLAPGQGFTSIADSAFLNTSSNFSLGTTVNNLALTKHNNTAFINIGASVSNVFIEGFLQNNQIITFQLSCNSIIANNTAPSGLLNNLSQFFIGRRPGIATTRTNVDIGEILYYNSNSYNSTSRFNPQIEGYLAWKWGIQNDLSNGHPYKRRPPS